MLFTFTFRLFVSLVSMWQIFPYFSARSAAGLPRVPVRRVQFPSDLSGGIERQQFGDLNGGTERQQFGDLSGGIDQRLFGDLSGGIERQHVSDLSGTFERQLSSDINGRIEQEQLINYDRCIISRIYLKGTL